MQATPTTSYRLQTQVYDHPATTIRTGNNHNNHDNILVEHCANQSNNNTEITLSSPVRSDDPILSLHQLPALTCPDPPLTARTIPGIFSSSAERAGSDTEWSTRYSGLGAIVTNVTNVTFFPSIEASLMP